MKNTGGTRWGGAIAAAQFIGRFVDDKTPWAHLDIAGTGFDSRQSDINKSWGSGWGVRLLDRLVADYYEGWGCSLRLQRMVAFDHDERADQGNSRSCSGLAGRHPRRLKPTWMPARWLTPGYARSF